MLIIMFAVPLLWYITHIFMFATMIPIMAVKSLWMVFMIPVSTEQLEAKHYQPQKMLKISFIDLVPLKPHW